jgi:hypothetical protein
MLDNLVIFVKNIYIGIHLAYNVYLFLH